MEVVQSEWMTVGKRVANNGVGWTEQYETVAKRALASLRPNTKRLPIELLPELRIVIDMLRCEESETTLRGTLQKDIHRNTTYPFAWVAGISMIQG